MSTDNSLSLFVRKLESHAGLSERDRQAVLNLPFRVRTFEASSYLVREGDRPTHCGVPLSGFAYRQKQTEGGARQIVSLHIPGEALDLQHLFLEVADHSVQMLTRGDVALIPMGEIRELVRSNPNVAEAVLASILVESSIFREWVLNVGRRDARTGMAHLLCEFAVRMRAAGLGGEDALELPITQEQFADALGLTTVHVNRTLRGLEKDGLLTRQKRNIHILSLDRLREVADFNQRYLHLVGRGAEPSRRELRN